MFKNVGKEIKNDLGDEVFFVVVRYILIPIPLLLILCIIELVDVEAAIYSGLVLLPLFGLIGYSVGRKKAMYRYAFGEIVENISKINILLAKQAVNQWQCPECHGLNNDTFNYCQSCGCKKP